MMSKKEFLIAVFDIGSASVGGLLFRQRKDCVPEVLASVRCAANYEEQEKNFSLAWRAMRKAFVSVTQHLQKTIPQKPDAALCVFSSPWHVSKTKIIKITRGKNFKVDDILLKKIIEDEAELFESRWRASSADEKKPRFFLEKRISKALLNGYDIKDPVGKSAHQMELYTYFSLGIELLEEEIKKDILHYIKNDNIWMNSFPYVLFKVMTNIMDTKKGMIVIDISGEITDVFVIGDGFIKEISSFPRGENFLLKRLAGAFNVGMDEARSTLLQYKRKELSDEYAQKTHAVLEAGGKEWGEYLKKLLKDISKKEFLPLDIYFCGPAGSLEEIYGQASGSEFADFTVVGKAPNVKFLLPESLKYHFDFKNSFSGNKDIFLLISSLFASRFLAPKYF